MSTGRFLDLGTFSPPGAPPRPVRVYVPRGVDPDRPHATLWLFDGQNVFHDEGSFAGGWHAHAAIDRLGDRRHHRPVVVAVGNGGAHRIRELGTHAEDFLHALVSTLVPRVESVVHGRGPRVIGGSSLGGLAALQAWLLHPEVFSGAMAMSPSLWFEGRRVLRAIERGHHPLPPRGRLYLDAGAREKGRMYADAERMSRLLAEAGLGEDRLQWRPDAKGTHHERHWRRRLPKAARFLFRR
jgi:predicted alpha/beta superfamily hydrolase